MSTTAQTENTCCTNAGISPAAYVTKGSISTLHGIPTYITGSSADHTILFITDIFGFDYVNNMQLADEYAAAGFTVVSPDMFLGGAMNPSTPHTELMAAFMQWIGSNTPQQSLQRIAPIVAQFAATSKTLQIVGFCYGVAESTEVFAHSHKPQLFNCAENDGLFTAELRQTYVEAAAAAAAATPAAPAAVFVVYPGTDHGFTVRPTNDQMIAQKAIATAHTIAFFKQHAGL